MSKKTKVIVTLGPSTNNEESLRKIKDKGVDFVRLNMSHSTLEELEAAILLSKKIGIPFIIDTQGSQVRSGDLKTSTIELEDGDTIKISTEKIVGDKNMFSLTPSTVTAQLEVGDHIQVDFDTVTLSVSDVSTIDQGYITVKAITGGVLGKNKAIVIDRVSPIKIELPSLSEIDYGAIKIGLEHGIGHIAFSFARSGEAVNEVRRATQSTMEIISKIECVDGLQNLDQIIAKSDFLLIDRGDLSKEIPVEKIPYAQKIILNKSRKQGVGVFVATNLLETMITKRKPTRAEVHDIINTILDGAYGLTLAAETAIGKYPMETINMLNKLIMHSALAANVEDFSDKEDLFVEGLLEKDYFFDEKISSSLISPHGGVLVDRVAKKMPSYEMLQSLPKVLLDENRERDVEQIAIGTYSPIEGFMGKEDFTSVLDRMKLSNGVVWSLPIILDVTKQKAAELRLGSDVALMNAQDEIVGLLHLEEMFEFDRKEVANKLYNTLSEEHPGVQVINSLHDVLLGGKVTLLKRRKGDFKEYELTPRQSRSLFEGRGWSKVVGFHTRNVIHKGHEFLQMDALKKMNCDGLFVHPVVGKKKAGDYNAKYIIKAYELMMKHFYPQNSAIFGTFSTYSRYAGPREALFTALCRKNFGCSHFIVGRDHTGVGSYYHPKAAHTIFDRFPNLGITPVCFDKIFYSKQQDAHLHEKDVPNHSEEDKFHVSGTQARAMLEAGKLPPSWFMRPEISQMIIDSIAAGEEVFVKKEVVENIIPPVQNEITSGFTK